MRIKYIKNGFLIIDEYGNVIRSFAYEDKTEDEIISIANYVLDSIKSSDAANDEIEIVSEEQQAQLEMQVNIEYLVALQEMMLM